MFPDKSGAKSPGLWQLYSMPEIRSVELIPDPGGVDNCFQLTLGFMDGNGCVRYLYMPQMEAERLAESIRMSAGISE